MGVPCGRLSHLRNWACGGGCHLPARPTRPAGGRQRADLLLAASGRCRHRSLTAMRSDTVRDALEQSGAASVAQAQGAADQARSASVPVAQPRTGRRRSTSSHEAANADAAAKVCALYDALPKDMVAPSGISRAKAKAIQAGMLPEHSPIAGEEGRLCDLASGYGGAIRHLHANALRRSTL